jgi:hypothetical protein
MSAARSPTTRSKVTNGNAILPGTDGRTAYVRRARDLIDLHLADLGGVDNASQAEQSIIRRIAILSVELEAWRSSSAR